jgi:hypothetical protein
MSKKFDVVAITGKYQDRDGNEKSRYVTIGAVIETSKGLSLKLEAVPVGWDGWAGLYEPKARDEAPQRSSRGSRNERDDPPF